MFRLLLDAAPGTLVTLEVFEDVGVEEGDGARLASQVKSGLTVNPLADKSVELWKTLANWCDPMDQGILDPSKTISEIYVAKPRKGQLASLLHSAQSRRRSPGNHSR